MIFVRSKTVNLWSRVWYLDTLQKMKFSIKDLITFTEEILNGKLHFSCRVTYSKLVLTNQFIEYFSTQVLQIMDKRTFNTLITISYPAFSTFALPVYTFCMGIALGTFVNCHWKIWNKSLRLRLLCQDLSEATCRFI